MKLLSATFCFVLLMALVACSASDQRKANEQAREAGHEISDEAKKAGREIKKDAKELGRQVDSAVNSGKVANADGKTKDAASRTEVKLDHAAMVGKVKSKLAADAGLSTLARVEVTLNGGGVVTLSGTAANEEQRKAAEIAAAQVDGVTRVRNHITVRP